MLKEYKKQAKKIIFSNYRAVIIPGLLYMTAGLLQYIIINVMLSVLNYYPPAIRITLLIFAVVLEFCIMPIALTLIFKIYILISNNEEHIIRNSMKFVFSRYAVCEIFKINFIPSMVHFVGLIFSSKSFGLFNPFAPIISVVLLCVLQYKFFAADYYFALSSEKAGKAIRVSFSTMKGKFLKFLYFDFSFFGWIILSVFIRVLLEIIICKDIHAITHNYYLPYLDAMSSFGYGVKLFLWPYKYITQAIYCKNLIGETKWDKTDSKQEVNI